VGGSGKNEIKLADSMKFNEIQGKKQGALNYERRANP
jgi:hypothetical protein